MDVRFEVMPSGEFSAMHLPHVLALGCSLLIARHLLPQVSPAGAPMSLLYPAL